MKEDTLWFRFDLQRFDDPGDSDPGNDPNSGNEPSGGSTDPDPKSSGTPRTFTQDELNAIASREHKRGGQEALRAFAKELGFESVDEMKAAAKAQRDAQEKAKSELEREREARQRAEAERQAAINRANERLFRAEVKATAVELGIIDPDAAFALMDREGVEVKDDGTVIGVKKALEALLKAKPYLAGKAQPGNRIGGPSNPAGGGGGIKLDMNDFIRRRAGRG